VDDPHEDADTRGVDGAGGGEISFGGPISKYLIAILVDLRLGPVLSKHLKSLASGQNIIYPPPTLKANAAGASYLPVVWLDDPLTTNPEIGCLRCPCCSGYDTGSKGWPSVPTKPPLRENTKKTNITLGRWVVGRESNYVIIGKRYR
jgi:hypothetical protein